VAKKITTRLMRKVDVAHVCQLIKEMAREAGEKAKINEDELITGCLGRKKLSAITLALHGKRIVGFAVTSDWFNVYMAIKFRLFLFIFVEKYYRKTGVATSLLRAIGRGAQKTGCARLICDAAKNNKPANKLYKKLGFEIVKNSVRYRLVSNGIA
jgi:ribosomal protein S18 acetylase RimI-like enzyme